MTRVHSDREHFGIEPSNVAVALRVSSWLVTARPTSTFDGSQNVSAPRAGSARACTESAGRSRWRTVPRHVMARHHCERSATRAARAQVEPVCRCYPPAIRTNGNAGGFSGAPVPRDGQRDAFATPSSCREIGRRRRLLHCGFARSPERLALQIARTSTAQPVRTTGASPVRTTGALPVRTTGA